VLSDPRRCALFLDAECHRISTASEAVTQPGVSAANVDLLMFENFKAQNKIQLYPPFEATITWFEFKSNLTHSE
jgi:hypothetical protein